MATTVAQDNITGGHGAGVNVAAPAPAACPCSGKCAAHAALVTQVAVLRDDLRVAREREAHMGGRLAGTDFLLEEYVALFHIMQEECRRLRVELLYAGGRSPCTQAASELLAAMGPLY